jgi:hypothetical protein
MNATTIRTRWAAVGAAVAVTLGAGGLGISYAASPNGATAFVPITPCRILDTRPAPDNIGNRATPIGAAQTHTVDAHGNNGNCNTTNGNAIPTGATGLQLNVTALGATSGTFLTVWATGATQPTVSSLNPQPGAPPIPNGVATGLSSGGQFDIYNNGGNVNVIVDVVGYYTDHNHDDRYYTEAEVDAAIAAAATSATSSAVATASTAAYSVGPLDVIDFGNPDVDTTIATLNLPAGNFVVNANTVANTNSAVAGQETMVGCELRLGTAVIADLYDPNFLLAAETTSGERESIALNGAGTLAAPGTATLVCRAELFPNGEAAAGSFIAPSITAIKVGSVTKQP